MASTIDDTSIDATFPVAGQDNNSQGFRDNFNTVKSNFVAAKSEITTLQTNSAKLNANKNYNKDVELKKEKEFNYSLPSSHNTFIYLINGEIKIGEKKHDKVKDSKLILLSKGKSLKVTAETATKFLVISGKPINEEIARGGPFVMNTKAEILQAVQDYHNGTFVK